MDKELKAQIKYTLIECIEESLNLIKKSSKEILKIKDKNEITGDNPVTQIDLDSQNLIINNINKKFPNHEILGEEGKEEKIVKSDFLWIIDPIDGTKNFINQIPFFCVSIAIVYKGEIIGGAVGLPWEKNSIIYAMKNEGISSNFSQKNYQDLKKYPVAGILSFAPTYFNLSYIVKNQFYKNSGELRNLGSAAAEMALVANGNAQLALSGYAFCWDFAAAWILIKESKKSIFYGNMKKNIWEDINPWKKYYDDGYYNLELLKKWRGKFFASNKEIQGFILKNIKPNGRSKTNIFRRFIKFLFLR
ncbi:MAG: inositol monophosphatase family protein [Chloroflexota bacterium]|nr:inositol monophosphatase family protein [Chloroflexota bacterium]